MASGAQSASPARTTRLTWSRTTVNAAAAMNATAITGQGSGGVNSPQYPTAAAVARFAAGEGQAQREEQHDPDLL